MAQPRAETLLETEVAALVDAAAHGELQGRIVLEGKQGFVRTLSGAPMLESP